MPYWASSCSSRWLKASHGQMTVMSAGQGGSRLRVPRPPVPPCPLGPVVHTPLMRVQGPLGVEPSSQDTPPLGGIEWVPCPGREWVQQAWRRGGARWALLLVRGVGDWDSKSFVSSSPSKHPLSRKDPTWVVSEARSQERE